jgi:drug/metabolite transporter (DMT)-like permease
MSRREPTPRVAPSILYALAAAALFGLSTPAAKALLQIADPWMLAGLLYVGSGVGLAGVRAFSLLAGRARREAPLHRRDLPWLAGAVATGGGIGPVLLMFGLRGGSAAEASLLLNLEGVLTACVAWFVFREHFDARIALGMCAITAGALVLAWQPGQGISLGRTALFVAGACVAWAIDNNLTRQISGGDAVVIAGTKGAVAGAVNLVVALALGAELPPLTAALGAGLVGFLGYGISLTLFVRALRDLGTARTGAYFSTAPFIGAAAAVAAFAEPLTARLLLGGALMGLGVWLHLTEHHSHEHAHDALEHEHLHTHDQHHQHDHDPSIAASEPHSHRHAHAPLRHAHRHYPDAHHRHPH